MHTSLIGLALAGTLAAVAAVAAPPQTLHVTETVEIKAPVDTVWAMVKDFDGM
ncbi:MAG: SRPBCC family protein, partial [Gammaproteobacteria bacterium]|nr:SRPBCC family protein [Gammaproteobacteria bacterium]